MIKCHSFTNKDLVNITFMTSMQRNIERDFHQAMVESYNMAKTEAHYNAR